MAQSVERRIGSAEVTGSIPVTSFLLQKRKPLEYKGFRFFFIHKMPRRAENVQISLKIL